ncbi:hypothetical protein HY450_02000 [Candidatus Pacearchaeota archaeon]|nr:hypothetical protein [Candidatus Pacearchaeota archaeon]
MTNSLGNFCSTCGKRTRNWKRIVKKVFMGSVVIAGLSGVYGYCTSSEYQRARELDRKATYIVPENSSGEEFRLESGETIRTGWYNVEYCGRSLELELNDKVAFRSERWTNDLYDGPRGDAKNLKDLGIKEGGEWHWFNRHNRYNYLDSGIENYEFWQNKYENLIDEVYNLAKARKIEEEQTNAVNEEMRKTNRRKAQIHMLEILVEKEKS